MSDVRDDCSDTCLMATQDVINFAWLAQVSIKFYYMSEFEATAFNSASVSLEFIALQYSSWYALSDGPKVNGIQLVKTYPNHTILP